MAKHGPANAWLLVSGYDLGAYATDYDDDKSAVLEPSHTLGDSWEKHLPVGVQQLAVTVNGFYDDANDASDEVLTGAQNTSRVVCYGVEGQTVGKRFVGVEGAYAAKVTRQSVRNALHKFTAALTVSGIVSEGVILQELESKTATWNTEGADSVDNGASSASGGVGFLQVTAFSGFTSFDGVVRHSADDITYVNLITFSNVTAAPAARRATVSGTVNRHLAFSGTLNGAGPGSVTVFCGFARNA